MGTIFLLGYDPLLEITCYNGMTTIKSELTSRTDSGDVRGIIRNVMEENKSPKLPGLPSFTGGLVGYFSYDYIKYSEPTLRLDAKDEEGFQDVNLMLFHKVIAFDNYRQKLILILNIKTDDLEINYHRAERELNNMKELLLNGEKAEHIPCKLRTDFNHCSTKQPIATWWRKPSITSEREISSRWYYPIAWRRRWKEAS